MSNSLGVSALDFQKKYEAIQKLQDDVSGKITAAQNDYQDDNIFNSIELPEATITMSDIQNMSYEDAKAVLDTESTTVVNQELSQAQETLSGLVEQFGQLQEEIDALKGIVTEKQNEYDKAVRQEEKAQHAKEEADQEVADTQSKISEAQSDWTQLVSQEQSDAYDEALSEYLNQNADEKIPEDDNEEKQEQRSTSDKQSFQSILQEKLRGINVSKSGISDAEANYANAKSLQEKCQLKLTNAQTKTSEAQQNLTAAITNYNNKETELTTIETQLGTLENKTIPALEQKMANATFVEQNKQTIAETVLAKDPDVIAAQTTIEDANTTVSNSLTNANNAKTNAANDAKDGNVTATEEEKQKAVGAQSDAKKAQQDAKLAEETINKKKAELEKLTGAKLTSPVADTMKNINDNVGLFDSIITDVAASVTAAGTVSTAQTTITTEVTTVSTQLGVAKAAQTAAEQALEKGDVETAKTEKQKAEAALKAAKEAQERAKQAQTQLESTNANDKKSSEISAIAGNITSIDDIVQSIDSKITKASANTEAAATREAAGVSFSETVDEVTGESTKDVNKLNLTNMISAEELNLVTENNIDLTELVTINGEYYPKYIIAKGEDDNKYHIYERNGKSTTEFKSLARISEYMKQHRKCCADASSSNEIVSQGNGVMHVSDESETAKSGFQEIFLVRSNPNCNFTCCDFMTTYKKYGTCSPLSLDLNGDGVKTSENVVNYDIDGDGLLDQINDSADAVLVFDADGDGISGENGKECFGNNTDLDGDGKADGYSDGFAALKALALKHNLINNDDDMVLDENDLHFLALSCGLKLKANGYNSEAQSLSDLGVTQISFAQTDKTTMVDNFDGMSNQIMYQEGTSCTVNGQEQEIADIWHQKKTFLNLTAA